jgi:hypothetical protein
VSLGWGVTNGIRAIAQLEMGGACTSLRRLLADAHWDRCQEWANPMRAPAGMLDPKRG